MGVFDLIGLHGGCPTGERGGIADDVPENAGRGGLSLSMMWERQGTCERQRGRKKSESASGLRPGVNVGEAAAMRYANVFFLGLLILNAATLQAGWTIQQLTNNQLPDTLANASGNKVVWQAFDGRDSEIMLFDGTQTVQLTNNDLPDEAPRISGNNVVWRYQKVPNVDDQDLDWAREIMFYDGLTVRQLTDNDLADHRPYISGSNVVWWQQYANDGEIMLFDGDTIPPVDRQRLPGFPTSGVRLERGLDRQTRRGRRRDIPVRRFEYEAVDRQPVFRHERSSGRQFGGLARGRQ